MNRFAVVLTVAACLVLSGCPTEKDAVRTLAGSKGVIEKEMGKHGECKPPSTTHTAICDALNQAIPAQHAAVIALDAYCSSEDYLTKGGKCLPPTDPEAKKQLQVKLTAAVNNLQPFINSVKAAGGSQ